MRYATGILLVALGIVVTYVSADGGSGGWAFAGGVGIAVGIATILWPCKGSDQDN